MELSARKRANEGVSTEPDAKFLRVSISQETQTAELRNLLAKLATCLKLRDKWMAYNGCSDTGATVDDDVPTYDVFAHPIPDASKRGLTTAMVDGVMMIVEESTDGIDSARVFSVPSFAEFVADYDQLRTIVHSGSVRSHAYKRMALLEAKFHIHTLLNSERELAEQKIGSSVDFHSCHRVDTHVHHSGCMTQKHLLRFIRRKLVESPNDVVAYNQGMPVTLVEALKGLDLTAETLTVDSLDMHAHDTYQRFDRFNNKFNPAGAAILREVFLKTDNALSGRYLAELTKEVITELEQHPHTTVEWRISIYGRKPSEWKALAEWFYAHRLAHRQVRWLIQVPRIYHVYRAGNQIESFGQLLRHVFAPIFANTLDPASDPALFYFLEAMVGFDSVDDESCPEPQLLSTALPPPDAYTAAQNPLYAYWMYYMAANLATLNQLRTSRGMKGFQFRPHAGEAGDPDHLLATFLVAHGINHGLLLYRSPGLHYLYYLAQVGIAMSPLCNSKLFVKCHKNPFPRYHRQGMNVSLSTDAPLLTHHTDDGLEEEYTVCAQMWKLSSVDLCEIARASVLQSGLERRFKQQYLGSELTDLVRTNVPSIRLNYRQELLQAEWDSLDCVE